MRQKLAGWKANVLSMAGRVTLVQSIRAAILVYTMQTCLLPVSLCNAMDKICRDFIWKGIHGGNHIHLVNWQTIQESKANGGLGIQKPHLMNHALLEKLGWRLQ